jgi:parvulin-like peptidyl-prolyl isomerase
VRALVLALLVALPAYAEDKPKPKATVGAIAVLERPAAMVAGKLLWESELEARMVGRGKGDRNAVLDEMIDENLWLRRAEELGLTATDDEVKLAFEEIKTQNSVDDAGIDKLLAAQNYTRARYLRELKRQLVILRAKNAEVGSVVKADREKAYAAWTARQRKRVHIERWP